MLTGMLLLGLQSGDGESKVDIEKETIAIRYGGHTLVLTVGSDRAVIDGEKVTLAAPVSEHFDSVYFPLRPVLAVLGFTVTWNEKQATVTLAHQELQQNLASQVMETIEEDPQRRLTFAFLPGDNDSYLAIVKEYGREDLRRQVRDFVAWLKAEGVI
jgi:hypothetical protein